MQMPSGYGGPQNSTDAYIKLSIAKLAQTSRDIGRALQPVVDVVPDHSLIIQALAVNNTTSSLQQLLWPRNGYLVGISAYTEDGVAASMAATQLRVLFEGTEDLFFLNSGTGAAYLNFGIINGLNNGGAFPYRRPIRAGVAWQAAVKTTANVTVDVAFHYIQIDQ